MIFRIQEDAPHVQEEETREDREYLPADQTEVHFTMRSSSLGRSTPQVSAILRIAAGSGFGGRSSGSSRLKVMLKRGSAMGFQSASQKWSTVRRVFLVTSAIGIERSPSHAARCTLDLSVS